ncbi:hypothetical protein HPB47_014924 [Ixodes persulcatus]|uniref:Uncharacterized protein n=1 Tax=Ixodes persulcatus TaxID=34615 RepID=A0AC60R1B8_IXOPE|nr:hypothetical protein HPB47_014924 [Ixodes persulcatus]
MAILDDEGFSTEVRRRLEHLGDAVDACAWEELKGEICNRAECFSRAKAAAARQEERDLTNTLRAILQEEERRPRVFAEDVKYCKERLLELLRKRLKGAQVRSREWNLEGETQPTKIFRTFERKRAEANHISSVSLEGHRANGQEEVAAAFDRHYSDLFRKEEGDSSSYPTLLQGLPVISEELREITSAPIRESEIRRAIKKISSNKAPGPDGIGAEFYKKYVDLLCPILVEVFRDIFERKLLPPSMRESLTVLIAKKNADKSNPAVTDYRPISLLCTDYKILAKSLARRLDLALGGVIGEHQAYGLRGRSISRNLHAMRIVREATGEGHHPLAVLQLDLSQAFDRVSHCFLQAMLRGCGVGDTMCDWVALCYRNISTRLLVNGERGRSIGIGRSVRQGCPLSPILFALQLEPLCQAINRDESIWGLQLGEQRAKLLAYADDITLICASKAQVEVALGHVELFCRVSGAAINRQNSAGAWLGQWAMKPTEFAGIAWKETLESYLGAPIRKRGPSMEVWRQKTNAIQSKLSSWLGRRLSFFNRAYVCNAVSYPAILYWAQAACCPGSTANQIHWSWARFIRRSSMERTRRSNLFLSLAAGGMGLVNVTVKLHVQRFLLFRDRRDPLFLSALHHLGLPYLGKWIASTTGRTTKGAGLRFYAEIAISIEFFFFLVHLSWEYLMTASRKKLYWDTLEVLLPAPLYRTAPAPQCASGLFKQVRKLPVSVTSKDFFVRLHLGVLPVKVWLDDRGLFVPWSTNCDLCGANETLPHVFLECSNAYLFWDEMRKDVGVDFPIDWHVFRYLDVEGTDAASSMVLPSMVLLGLHAIWLARSAMVECHTDARPTWDYFTSRLRWLLSIAAGGMDQVCQEWRAIEERLEARRLRHQRIRLGEGRSRAHRC